MKRSPGTEDHFDVQGDLPPLELSGDSFSFAGPVRAHLIARNTGSVLTAEGEIAGKLTLTCGRCLEPYVYDFEVPLNETYAPAADDNKDGEVIPFTGDMLDISPEVLKSIIISLPMKMVCINECPGLCPGCGRKLAEGRCDCENDEIDPRLSILKNLMEKNEK